MPIACTDCAQRAWPNAIRGSIDESSHAAHHPPTNRCISNSQSKSLPQTCSCSLPPAATCCCACCKHSAGRTNGAALSCTQMERSAPPQQHKEPSPGSRAASHKPSAAGTQFASQPAPAALPSRRSARRRESLSGRPARSTRRRSRAHNLQPGGRPAAAATCGRAFKQQRHSVS